MTKIEHFAHECPFRLHAWSFEGICSLCCKETEIHYTCFRCDFNICETCYHLPSRELSLTLHPQHLLQFHQRQPYEKPNSFVCTCCGHVSSGCYYTCKTDTESSPCKDDIKVDLECASNGVSIYTTTWDMKTTFHYSHRHMLTRCLPERGFLGLCLLCDRHVSDTTISYGCVHCLCFVHERCLDDPVPRKIRHPVHPKHPLVRLDYTQHRGREFRCDACQDLIFGVPFGCTDCRFNLHIGCVDTTLRNLGHKSCSHGLFYIPRNAQNAFSEKAPCHLCKGSKKIFKNCYYRCVECDRNFHFECLKIPLFAFRKSRHLHQLRLRLFESDDELYCDICEAMLHVGGHAYHCKECDFGAHIECFLGKDEQSPMYLRCLPSDHSGNVARETIQEYPRANLFGNAHSVRGFRHRGLPLKLVLLSKPVTTKETACDICKKQVVGFNLFCRECDFVVCERCIDQRDQNQNIGIGESTCLRGHSLVQHSNPSETSCRICGDKIRESKAPFCYDCYEMYHSHCIRQSRRPTSFPFHHHKLCLGPKPSQCDLCSLCRQVLKSYSYNCYECLESYHTKCPETPEPPLKLPNAHEHDLHYSWARSKATEADEPGTDLPFCSRCKTKCTDSFYGCFECGFISHLKCLPLQEDVDYFGHVHTVTLKPSLNTVPFGSGNDALMCSLCHFSCDPMGPGYTCELCHVVCHVECLISQEAALENEF